MSKTRVDPDQAIQHHEISRLQQELAARDRSIRAIRQQRNEEANRCADFMAEVVLYQEQLQLAMSEIQRLKEQIVATIPPADDPA